MAESNSSGHQTLGRVSDVLDWLTHHPETRVSQISHELGLPQSTLSRLLASMEGLGLVRRDTASGLYYLGDTLITLGTAALNQNRLHASARQIVVELSCRLSLGVNVAVLNGSDIFYVFSVDGVAAPRPYSLIGSTKPAHATALGHVLLSYLPPDEREAIRGRIEYHRYTPKTISSWDALSARLAQVCDQGWDMEVEELALGRGCVAAPIRDRHGETIAALSVSGPLSATKLPRQAKTLSATVIEAADDVSGRLGFVPAYSRSRRETEKCEFSSPERLDASEAS